MLLEAGGTAFGHNPFVECKLGIVVFSSSVFNPIVEKIDDRSAVVDAEVGVIVHLGIGYCAAIARTIKDLFFIIEEIIDGYFIG